MDKNGNGLTKWTFGLKLDLYKIKSINGLNSKPKKSPQKKEDF